MSVAVVIVARTPSIKTTRDRKSGMTDLVTELLEPGFLFLKTQLIEFNI